jgi:hypothetical protein
VIRPDSVGDLRALAWIEREVRLTATLVVSENSAYWKSDQQSDLRLTFSSRLIRHG